MGSAIIASLSIARKKGLIIPIVFNTGGYDSPQIIKMLNGTIDIYMPDARYSSNILAEKYSQVKNYIKYNRQSLKEMYRQVGGLRLDSNGIAKKGLLVRLLVMPNNIGGIKETLDFIKNELSTDVYLSIMAQYQPTYKAKNYPELSRRITSSEYLEIVEYAEELGFNSGWTQDYISLNTEDDLFVPGFNSEWAQDAAFVYMAREDANVSPRKLAEAIETGDMRPILSGLSRSFAYFPRKNGKSRKYNQDITISPDCLGKKLQQAYISRLEGKAPW
jgi:hypothetical protein